jgi:hypothetical protein
MLAVTSQSDSPARRGRGSYPDTQHLYNPLHISVHSYGIPRLEATSNAARDALRWPLQVTCGCRHERLYSKRDRSHLMNTNLGDEGAMYLGRIELKRRKTTTRKASRTIVNALRPIYERASNHNARAQTGAIWLRL